MRQFQVIKTVGERTRPYFSGIMDLKQLRWSYIFRTVRKFWCVIASVSANKLACEGLLVGADEQKKGEQAVIKQTIEKRREERREKLL